MPVYRTHRSPKCKLPLSVSSGTSKETALKPDKWFWIYAQSEIYWGDKDRIKKDRMQRCFRSHRGISCHGCPGKLALGSLQDRVRELALGLCDTLEPQVCCSWGPVGHRTRCLLAPAGSLAHGAGRWSALRLRACFRSTRQVGGEQRDCLGNRGCAAMA